MPDAPFPLAGEAAALATAVAWAASGIFFALAGDRVGAATVNRTRLAAAVLCLGTTVAAAGGTWPWEIPSRALAYLCVSGLVGFWLGDACYFRALVHLGPRLSMLLYSTWPILTALLGWAALEQTVSPAGWTGMLLALASVLWVVAEKRTTSSPNTQGRIRLGLLLSGLGVVGQAVGYVLATAALDAERIGGRPVTALEATLARASAATAAIWIEAALAGRAAGTWAALRAAPRAAGQILGGTVFGPFVGVWLSLVAVGHAPLATASTLIATTPIWAIPMSFLVYGDRASPRSLLGTVGAFAGIAILVRAG